MPIRWIEYAPNGFREVSYETASRAGEPFAEVIAKRGYLPHPGTPYCSSEVKFRPVREFMRSLGHDEWDALIGLRADEPDRVAGFRGCKVEGGWVECRHMGVHAAERAGQETLFKVGA